MIGEGRKNRVAFLRRGSGLEAKIRRNDRDPFAQCLALLFQSKGRDAGAYFQILAKQSANVGVGSRQRSDRRREEGRADQGDEEK